MTLAAAANCDVCLRNCEVGEGVPGFCGIWGLRDGRLTALEPFRTVEVAVDRVEKKPIFHFAPGARVYALGGWGCTFHCGYCRNWRVACTRATPEDGVLPPPAEFSQIVRANGCEGVAWSFTEATMWFETILPYVEQSHAEGLFNLMLSNGAASPRVYRALVAAGVGVWKIDLKGFSKASYLRQAEFEGFNAILDNLVLLRKLGCHIEISHCPIPGWEYGESEVRDMARWIASTLGTATPLHLLRFFPAFRMTSTPSGDAGSLSLLRRELIADGLPNVYVPLSLDEEEVSTRCNRCTRTIVKRNGLGPPSVMLTDTGGCGHCGEPTPIQVLPARREARRARVTDRDSVDGGCC